MWSGQACRRLENYWKYTDIRDILKPSCGPAAVGSHVTSGLGLVTSPSGFMKLVRFTSKQQKKKKKIAVSSSFEEVERTRSRSAAALNTRPICPADAHHLWQASLCLWVPWEIFWHHQTQTQITTPGSPTPLRSELLFWSEPVFVLFVSCTVHVNNSR